MIIFLLLLEVVDFTSQNQPFEEKISDKIVYSGNFIKNESSSLILVELVKVNEIGYDVSKILVFVGQKMKENSSALIEMNTLYH